MLLLNNKDSYFYVEHYYTAISSSDLSINENIRYEYFIRTYITAYI